MLCFISRDILLFLFRSSEGSASASGKIDLASHTLALSPEGKLQVVPLDPSKIKTKTKPSVSVSPPQIDEEVIAPALATTAETAPRTMSASGSADMDVSFSASAGASSPGLSTSLDGGASGSGRAEVNLNSPAITVSGPKVTAGADGTTDSADAGVEMRSKRKGFSLPGFGKKHRSLNVEGDAGATGGASNKERGSKTLSMPGFKKKSPNGKRIYYGFLSLP